MENVKKLKRGEILFKEGDPVNMVYLIQSGKIGLMVERGQSRLEVASFGASAALGELGLFSNARHAFTAEALQETKVLEVPLEMMKQQLEKSPPGVKILLKSLVDEAKQSRQATKMLRLETEKTPCPQGSIHKVFTEMHLISRHIGKKDPANLNIVSVSWSSLKLYASRFFGESPQRLRQLMDLLSKLKMAELTIGKNDEGEEDLQSIKFANVQLMEDFAEFFQYHLFKGSKAEAIFVDPLALKVAQALVDISAVSEVDHKGASKVDYSLVLTEFKKRTRMELKNTHMDVLEKKGLFVKRQSFDDGRIVLSFDRNEFLKTSQYWAILLEIDKWNEKGFVDLNEKSEMPADGASGCPQCSAAIEAVHKFCPACGFKLAA